MHSPRLATQRYKKNSKYANLFYFFFILQQILSKICIFQKICLSLHKKNSAEIAHFYCFTLFSPHQMATVIFKKDSSEQSLSGTFAGITYRTHKNGKKTAWLQPEPFLPDNHTKEQELSYRRTVIIRAIVKTIQEETIGDFATEQQAINFRTTIRDRVRRAYTKMFNQEPDILNDHTNEQIIELLLKDYHNRFL